MTNSSDKRHHVHSMLMRESLLDKNVIASTEKQTPVVRMLPDVHVLKVGSRTILEAGHATVRPLVDKLGEMLGKHKIIFGVGG